MVNLPSIELLHHSYTDQLYDGNDGGSICQMAMPIVTPYDPWILYWPIFFAEFSSVLSLIPGKLHTWKESDLLYCIVCVQIDKELRISPVFLQTWVANWSWQFPTFQARQTPPIQSLTWIKISEKSTICRLFSGFWRGGIMGCWCLWCFWGLILKRCPLDNHWHWSMGHKCGSEYQKVVKTTCNCTYGCKIMYCWQ